MMFSISDPFCMHERVGWIPFDFTEERYYTLWAYNKAHTVTVTRILAKSSGDLEFFFTFFHPGRPVIIPLVTYFFIGLDIIF